MSTIVKAKLDPRFKQAINSCLREHIYANVNARFAKRLEDLIGSNTLKMGATVMQFNYKGKVYILEKYVPRYNVVRLHPDFHEAMDVYLADQRKLDYEEKPYVFSYFTKVLNSSDSLLDYARLLPECMHNALKPFMAEEYAIYHLNPELSDQQVAQFKNEHEALSLILKSRVVLDLLA